MTKETAIIRDILKAIEWADNFQELRDRIVSDENLQDFVKATSK